MAVKSHLQARTTRIYSNNSVYSPAGRLMFRCSDKKLNWYLRKQLAEVVPADLYARPSIQSSDADVDSACGRGGVNGHEEGSGNGGDGTVEVEVEGGQTIRLLFEPRGTGRNRAGDEWYLEDQVDKCVVCGRRGIVSSTDQSLDAAKRSAGNPAAAEGRGREGEGDGEEESEYRREMPVSFKSHGSHDVLAVCTLDHDRYEKFADAEKMKLVTRYGAPLGGKGWLKSPGNNKVRAAASALLRYRRDIPPSRIEELQGTLMSHYRLTSKEEISADLLSQALDLKSMTKGDDFRDHGQIVIGAIGEEEGEDGFARFVRFWRRHFLDTMKPAHLSKRWSVDDPVNLVAGEYNPYRPEMDGS
ncbi:protein of unknown function [Taphrina deformans PYCC 5710]|uniref:Uncharacterized protein n=1 Tax=Taphrina deformans (strain PYCC 5710 / ATCC 11124 / CBS 356.35 / IMI 108563 / JCM 9778 / NBRC 8474) TaxID=1097556 RepID=R4XFX3_TAPDE|nr:protein of unknown function [Taphrina deformans PYCC 5710]|eukprot:CCG83394.1 protein of unknown function [Taphrina deformans PYCC 5710]